MEHHFMPRWSLLWIALVACTLGMGNVWGQGEEEVFTFPLAPPEEVEVPVLPEIGETPEPAETSESAEASESAETPKPATEEKKITTGEKKPAEEKADSISGMVNTCWDLLKRGGFLMWPIGFISILVLAVGLERLFALCGCFCMPKRLFEDLNSQVAEDATPRIIFKTAKNYSCAGSNVIQALLFKTGRPMLEVQAEYEEAKNREANRLFRPVRILVLAASVTPLIGLLGTVIGMIQAFIEVSNLSEATAIGANRADLLAQGIYVALVTTCAGLIVAIPAAILAHWYEGRISRLFQKLDQNLVNFFSWMESKEGKVRVTPDLLNGKAATRATSKK